MEPTGGQGEGVSRSELQLEEQALRNDWPIPPAVKRQVLQRLIDYLDRDCDEGATAPDRVVIAAARVLAQFGGLSLRQASLDLEREKLDRGEKTGTLADLVAEAEKRAEALDRERRAGTTDGTAGAVPR